MEALRSLPCALSLEERPFGCRSVCLAGTP